MKKCDICANELSNEDMQIVSASKVKRARGLGYVPSTLPFTNITGKIIYRPDIWNIAVESNLTKDWGVCDFCLNELEESIKDYEKFTKGWSDDEIIQLSSLRARAWFGKDVSAVEQLVYLNDKSIVDLLSFWLFSKNYKEYELAATALEKFASPRSVEPLMIALKTSKYDFVREYAADTLRKMKDQRAADTFLDVWIELINRDRIIPDDLGIIWKVASGIEEFRDLKAIDFLTRAFDNEDERIRSAAACALKGFNDGRVVSTLINALSDENDKVRYFAAKSLGELRNTKATDALQVASNDRDKKVRKTAKKALKSIVSKNKAEKKSFFKELFGKK